MPQCKPLQRDEASLPTTAASAQLYFILSSWNSRLACKAVGS